MKLSQNYTIYCDGSCNNRSSSRAGGWGVAVYDEKEVNIKECSGFAVNTSSNRMELTAMINALQLAISLQKATNAKVCIYSDSMYTVNSANLQPHQLHTYLPNGDLIDILVKLRKVATKAFIFHVKGHNGVLGNERAHSLAYDEFQKAKQFTTNATI